MSNVIALIQAGSEPRVDSRQLAGHLGVKHKHTLELIRRYASKFKRFGQLPFQTAVGASPHGGGNGQRFALLNEDQCYFLLALSRNTERVVDLKADLVAAFSAARKAGAAARFSIMEQLMALEIEDKGSFAKGRFGSHLMHERKGDLRFIRPRRAELELQLQPSLELRSPP